MVTRLQRLYVGPLDVTSSIKCAIKFYSDKNVTWLIMSVLESMDTFIPLDLNKR